LNKIPKTFSPLQFSTSRRHKTEKGLPTLWDSRMSMMKNVEIFQVK